MSNISKDLMAASSIPLILTIIKEEETYGYELIQKIKEASNGVIVWQEGSLYPVLKKLQNKELIRSKWSQTPTGKKRKYYSITMKGENELNFQKKQWVFVNDLLDKLWEQKITL